MADTADSVQSTELQKAKEGTQHHSNFFEVFLLTFYW